MEEAEGSTVGTEAETGVAAVTVEAVEEATEPAVWMRYAWSNRTSTHLGFEWVATPRRSRQVYMNTDEVQCLIGVWGSAI